MGENNRYQKAVERNLYELAHALMDLKVDTAFGNFFRKNEVNVFGQSFFRISKNAVFNDMMAHVMKVLEKNKRSNVDNFWYILKKDNKKIKNLAAYSIDRIILLRNLAKKLKIIRDKTHFHLDKIGVFDPSKIWKEADVKRNELIQGLNCSFNILEELYREVFKKPFLFHPDDYDGEDLVKILVVSGREGIIDVVPKALNNKEINLGS